MKAYPHGALYRLLRVLDLRLGAILRSVLISSLDAWGQFVRSSTAVKPLLNQLHLSLTSSKSDLTHDGGSTSADSIVLPVDQCWRRGYNLRLRDTEMYFNINRQRSSLFQVQLVVDSSSGN